MAKCSPEVRQEPVNFERKRGEESKDPGSKDKEEERNSRAVESMPWMSRPHGVSVCLCVRHNQVGCQVRRKSREMVVTPDERSISLNTAQRTVHRYENAENGNENPVRGEAGANCGEEESQEGMRGAQTKTTGSSKGGKVFFPQLLSPVLCFNDCPNKRPGILTLINIVVIIV